MKSILLVAIGAAGAWYLLKRNCGCHASSSSSSVGSPLTDAQAVRAADSPPRISTEITASAPVSSSSSGCSGCSVSTATTARAAMAMVRA